MTCLCHNNINIKIQRVRILQNSNMYQHLIVIFLLLRFVPRLWLEVSNKHVRSLQAHFSSVAFNGLLYKLQLVKQHILPPILYYQKASKFFFSSHICYSDNLLLFVVNSIIKMVFSFSPSLPETAVFKSVQTQAEFDTARMYHK